MWLDEILSKENYRILESGLKWKSQFDPKTLQWRIGLVKVYEEPVTRSEKESKEEETDTTNSGDLPENQKIKLIESPNLPKKYGKLQKTNQSNENIGQEDKSPKIFSVCLRNSPETPETSFQSSPEANGPNNTQL